VHRSLCSSPTLAGAISHLGFVQADPIRAPARAQDLILRHRVPAYRAGDLEAAYPSLAIEEDFFINYGFMPQSMHALMHPRTARGKWGNQRLQEAQAVLTWIAERGIVHPREVDAAFQHGKVRNWFGGQSNATTQLLDGMHYRGMLRVAKRESGVRMYAACEHKERSVAPLAAMDALVDTVVSLYAPLPATSLTRVISMLRPGAPQWQHLRKPALARAKQRLASTTIDGTTWYWPATENPAEHTSAHEHNVRLLAPFDPVVWDRTRFELLWDWAYRFEAYTPAAKRTMGYYALPLLWREHVIGWANASFKGQMLNIAFGYVTGKPPQERAFARALEAEVERLRLFLSTSDAAVGEQDQDKNRQPSTPRGRNRAR
jgi:uncharacterized protein YcaQ